MLSLRISRFALYNFLWSSARFSTLKNGETYYDILKLRKDCSTQDIRNAFLQLSKQFHPDVKGVTTDPKQTAQFLKISEAYQTLSKPKSRSAYDQQLWEASGQSSTHRMYNTEIHRPWEIRPNYDPQPKPYYGVEGIEKVKNWKVAMALTALCIFGAIVGFVSVKHSFTFNRKKLDIKSKEAGDYHAAIRADAEKYGNTEQMRRMLARMTKENR